MLTMMKREVGIYLRLDLKADGYSFDGVPLNTTTKVLDHECVSTDEVRHRYEIGEFVKKEES